MEEGAHNVLEFDAQCEEDVNFLAYSRILFVQLIYHDESAQAITPPASGAERDRRERESCHPYVWSQRPRADIVFKRHNSVTANLAF